MKETKEETTVTKTAETKADKTETEKRLIPGNGSRGPMWPPSVESRREKLVYGVIAFCGAVIMTAVVLNSCGKESLPNAAAAQTTQPHVRLIDASKCRKDQIRVISNTLVTDSDCTVITYDDEAAK